MSRKLNDREYELVARLLQDVSGEMKKGLQGQLEKVRVKEINDGGMGSLMFLAESPDERRLQQTVAEAEFPDDDGTLVSVTLNLDQFGQLFELDIWKVDFSPLQRWPNPEEIKLKWRRGNRTVAKTVATAMTKNRKKSQLKTAGELLAELENDPEYHARMLQQRRQERANIEQYANAAKPILADMKAIGFRLKSIGELRESGADYSPAIPVLLRWLPKVSYLPLKEDIVRSLAVPWASPAAAPSLIEAFKSSKDPTGTGIRWAIANSLAVVADDSVFEDIAELLQDVRYGRSREMLALALANMKDPRAVPVLMDLLEDEEIVGHVIVALGKLRVVEALSRIEALSKHPKKWVRVEAEKAIASIRSAESR